MKTKSSVYTLGFFIIINKKQDGAEIAEKFLGKMTVKTTRVAGKNLQPF
jgi:hypothetical protein